MARLRCIQRSSAAFLPRGKEAEPPTHTNDSKIRHLALPYQPVVTSNVLAPIPWNVTFGLRTAVPVVFRETVARKHVT